MPRTGALMAMPMLIINMGGEMVYILHQRLQAQEVEVNKTVRVLEDVLRAMFSTKFVAELFKPQEMYSNSSTRAIFNKLAHSSIMKLNESSMDKLYDLMAMGFKFQILSSLQPQALLQITLNHLELLRKTVKGPAVLELIDCVIQKCISTYSCLSGWGWMQLQYKLLEFFQGRRVKVSLFLQNDVQRVDGSMVLRIQGPVPIGSDIPGTVRYYEADHLVSSSAVDVKNADGLERAGDSYLDPRCPLGMNIYVADAEALKPGAKGLETENTIAAAKAIAKTMSGTFSSPEAQGECKAEPKTGGIGGVGGGPGGGGVRGGVAGDKAKGSAAEELSLLASLIGTGDVYGGDKLDLQPFKLNLFPEDSLYSAQSKDDDDEGVPTIHIDLSLNRNTAAKLLDDFDDDDNDHNGGGARRSGGRKAAAKDEPDDEDDLLALMDSAK